MMEQYTVTATLVVRLKVFAMSRDDAMEVAASQLTTPMCWQSFGEFHGESQDSPVVYETQYPLLTSIC
jgi:hypothetical protein